MEIYFDCEFDSIQDGEKHRQCVVSIGAVSEHPSSEFYALIKPKKFKRLTSVVRKMTQLKDHDILSAPSFTNIMQDFNTWSHVEQEEVTLYSFGPDDRRTILEHAEFEHYQGVCLFEHVINLQTILSETVCYEGKPVSPTLSLDDLKYVYDITGDVLHNALNDALDLMHIHQAYKKGKQPNAEKIKEIVERKIAKQEESRRKQEAHMAEVLKKRYQKLDRNVYTIPFYPAVREQFSFLEEQEHSFHIKFSKQGMMMQGECIPYENQSVTIIWHVSEERPYLQVMFNPMRLEKEIPLTYRNAGIYDAMKNCRDQSEHIARQYQNEQITLKRFEPEMLTSMMALFYDTIHTVNIADYNDEQIAAWAPAEYDEKGMTQRFLSSYTMTAWKQDTLVGFANISGKGMLDCLYVHKDTQQSHIGALLVQAMEAYAEEKGMERIETHASITAKPFFEKMGYYEIKANRVYRKKQMMINYIMRKSL